MQTRAPLPLVLATRSAGKIRELRALCGALGYASDTLDELGVAETSAEDGIECFETFVENAEAKARYFAALLPGRVILAEDSGLEVDALAGAPGVRSKRWAASAASGAQLDAENNVALLHALTSAAQAAQAAQAADGAPIARTARYRCVAVCVSEANTWRGAGQVEGVITMAPRGIGGFGYDPYFESAELGKTFAEALPEEKSRVSHRARALWALFAEGKAALRERVQRVS